MPAGVEAGSPRPLPPQPDLPPPSPYDGDEGGEGGEGAEKGDGRRRPRLPIGPRCRRMAAVLRGVGACLAYRQAVRMGEEWGGMS